MSGKSITSMVLGILSILLGFWGIIPLMMGIVAIVLAGYSLKLKESGKGMAITGLITGILGVISSFFWTAIWAAVFIA